ncbi:MAG: hypothetical protein QXG03_05710 [Halalkalicoccus sp.]
MFPDDRSEHEPDEPDLGPPIPNIEPEETEPELGPQIPDVSPPDGGFLGPEDAPKELLGAFWKLVLLLNVGLLAASLGALLLIFEGRLRLGGGLLAAGLLALARGLYTYWKLDVEELGTDSD